jgi:hypothetical protein
LACAWPWQAGNEESKAKAIFFSPTLTQQMRNLEIAIPVHGAVDEWVVEWVCFASIPLLCPFRPIPLGPTAENTE